MRQIHISITSLCLGAALVAGCSDQTGSTASSSQAGSRPSVSVSGAYVQLQNGADPFVGFALTSSQEDVITGVSVSAGGSAIMAEKQPEPTASPGPATSAPPVFKPGQPVSQVPVPAAQPVLFGPGGYGLFLSGRDPKPGKSVVLRLNLEKAGAVPVTAVVRPAN